MRKFLKWFFPGLKVKRWLFLMAAGLFVLILGLTLLSDQHLFSRLEMTLRGVMKKLTGAEHETLIGLFFLLTGLFAVYLGMQKTIQSIITTLLPESEQKIIDILYNRHYLRRGPRVVVIGGGTGLSVLLRGLKKYTSNITAIVTVADDGGSSGQLRGEMGILPPGDIRNCLVALADRETLLEELLQFRFTDGSLEGHNLGNLFIAALTRITGRFEQAVKEMSRVLAVRGQVLPATLEDVTLYAELEDGTVVAGESRIGKCRGIKRVYIKPEDCEPLPEAVEAIAEADAVVIGPGSLYTSIMPNLLVQRLREAVKNSPAVKIYVCNIMTQPEETHGYTASRHVQALLDHFGPGLFDYVIVNEDEPSRKILQECRRKGYAFVKPDIKAIEKMGLKVKTESLWDRETGLLHDGDKLARVILATILENKTAAEKLHFLDPYLLVDKIKGISRFS